MHPSKSLATEVTTISPTAMTEVGLSVSTENNALSARVNQSHTFIIQRPHSFTRGHNSGQERVMCEVLRTPLQFIVLCVLSISKTA